MPPEINLINEKNNGECVLNLINESLVLSAHDISTGGLIVALAEMSMNSNFGANMKKPKKLTNLTNYLFGEDQARYVIEVENKNLKNVEKTLKKNNIFYENIGFTQKNFFEIEGEMRIEVKELFKINNEWYNNY